jgi:hypothetical protein
MGFLSDLFSEVTMTPQKRLDMTMRAQQQQEAQQYDLQQQRLGAMGMQQQAQARQDYMPLLRQMPTTAAAALGPLLTSQDPRQQAFGMQQLQEYQRRGSPETQLGMAGQQQAQTNAATDQAQQAALFPGQLQGQRLDNQYKAGQMAAANAPPAVPPPLSRGQQLSQAFEMDTGQKVPTGMRAQLRTTPDGQGFVDVQPIEGTPEYNKADEALKLQEENVKLIDDFQDTLAEYGTEYSGGKAAELFQKRDRILANYGALEGLGILQPGDLQRLDRALPDPTAFGNQLNPNAASNMQKIYGNLHKQMVSRLKDSRQRFWYITPGKVTPAEQAKRGP